MNRGRRLGRWFGTAIVVAGILILWAGSVLESVSVPMTPWRLSASVVLASGAGALLLGLLAVFLPARWGLAGTMLTYCSLALFALGYRPPSRGSIQYIPQGKPRVFETDTVWCEPYSQGHPRYGNVGMPNVAARHHHRDFDEVYHFGPDGYRVMPTPQGPAPHPLICFLGCSYTFGSGVKDEETFSYILAKEAWPEMEVRNLSLPGWGTGQCLLVLEDLLSNGEKPACVLYGYIANHLKRNSRRKSWRSLLNANFPDFNEQGDFLGLRKPAEAELEDNAETYELERRIALGIVRRMRELCLGQGVPFCVLVLQDENQPLTQDILADTTLNPIDLRETCDELRPHDYHPTARTQRALANAIASDRRISQVANLAQLYRPNVVPSQPIDPNKFYLQLGEPDADAVLSPLAESAGVRVDPIRSTKANPYAVQVYKPIDPIVAGGKYIVRFNARAETPRPLNVGVYRRISPFHSLGLASGVELESDWKSFEQEFVASQDDVVPCIRFAVGATEIPLEISNVQIAWDGVTPMSRISLETPGRSFGVHGSLTQTKDGILQIRDLASPEKVPWHVQLNVKFLPLREGESYEVTCRMRAATLRSVELLVQKATRPFNALGFNRTIELTPEWQDFRYPFKATGSDSEAMITLLLGRSEVDVELLAPKLFCGGAEIEPHAVPASRRLGFNLTHPANGIFAEK